MKGIKVRSKPEFDVFLAQSLYIRPATADRNKSVDVQRSDMVVCSQPIQNNPDFPIKYYTMAVMSDTNLNRIYIEDLT